MNESLIKGIFHNRKPNFLDVRHTFSVLIPIVKIGESFHILFEVRGQNMSQPGEICFPGGRAEVNELPVDTAIRETMEELLLQREQIEVIGPLDLLITPFNLLIHPYVGILKGIQPASIGYNPQEVASIFLVPLEELLGQEPLYHQMAMDFSPDETFPYHLIAQGEQYPWKKGKYSVYFYRYQDKIIWGITAKILKNFLDLLRGEAANMAPFTKED